MVRIPEVREAIGAVLLSLGDGNWRMGDGLYLILVQLTNRSLSSISCVRLFLLLAFIPFLR